MAEKRGARRVAFVADVECEETSWRSVHRNARVADISLGGVFIDSLWAFPVGSAVRLKFTLPSLEMSVLAEVVNSMPPHGMGLRFRELSPAQRLAVQGLMAPETTPHPLETLLEAVERGVGSLPMSPDEEIPAIEVREESEEEEAEQAEGAVQDQAPVAPEAPPSGAATTATAAYPEESADEPALARHAVTQAPGPEATTSPPPPAAAVPTSRSDGSGRKRVLVIDDHDRTRAMLRGMIEGRYNLFEVVEAADGLEGVRAVREGPPFDLIFLDVEMPNLDGLGACRKLREMGVRTPIIFLTGRDGLDDFRAGREAGADSYIKKPIILGTLRSVLGLFTSGAVMRR
jgi:CheY-like chemotaxis protein